jgi:hypothetical protein
MLLLRITALEFSALLQHRIALYCVLPDMNKSIAFHISLKYK